MYFINWIEILNSIQIRYLEIIFLNNLIFPAYIYLKLKT